MLRRRVRPAHREGYRTSKRERRERERAGERSNAPNTQCKSTARIKRESKTGEQYDEARRYHTIIFFSPVFPNTGFHSWRNPRKYFTFSRDIFWHDSSPLCILEMLVSRVNSLIKMHRTSSFQLRASCSECLATSPTIVRNSDDWFY